MVDLKTQKNPLEINWPLVPTDKFVPGSIALLYLRNVCFDQFIYLAHRIQQPIPKLQVFLNFFEFSWIFLKLIVSELVVGIQELEKWADIKLSLFTQCLFLISSFILLTGSSNRFPTPKVWILSPNPNSSKGKITTITMWSPETNIISPLVPDDPWWAKFNVGYNPHYGNAEKPLINKI